MKILAIIPARGGSKRLPGKNIRVLGGKPLINWTIDVCKNLPEICDILVSTDDTTIAEISANAGAYVPWLRPAELASDTASSVDVALHALDWYETEKGAVDGILLLQPTSPFRTKESVRKGIELFRNSPHQSVLGVSPAHSHPMWTMKVDNNLLVPYFEDHGFGKRSQELPEAFVINGCLYLISPSLLREKKSFFDSSARPLVIESFQEDLDIDTEKDWQLAERLVNGSGHSQSTLLKQTEFSTNMDLSASTKSYLLENEAAFSLHRQKQVHRGKPRKVDMATMGGIIKRKVTDSTIGSAKYIRELLYGWSELPRLTSLKGSKKGKRAIVIGNGPSQGLISTDALDKFKVAGNDIFAVNFWNQNSKLSKIPPKYLVISDPETLSEPKINGSQRASVLKGSQDLKKYLLEHEDIILFAPVTRIKYLKKIYGENRVLGFFDTEMRSLSTNIDPRFPRGYVSMTLYKALALAVYMGYEQIYLIGMDNTYPRDIFCDHDNKILNYERHADTEDYLIDQTELLPSMDVWAQEIFLLFYDLRRCFAGARVLNLDSYSLTDVFPKISSVKQIEALLNCQVSEL